MNSLSYNKLLTINLISIVIEVIVLILCFNGILAMSYGDLADNNYLALSGIILCQCLLIGLTHRFSPKEKLTEYLKAILFVFLITAIWIATTIEFHYRFLVTGF